MIAGNTTVLKKQTVLSTEWLRMLEGDQEGFLPVKGEISMSSEMRIGKDGTFAQDTMFRSIDSLTL